MGRFIRRRIPEVATIVLSNHERLAVILSDEQRAGHVTPADAVTAAVSAGELLCCEDGRCRVLNPRHIVYVEQ